MKCSEGRHYYRAGSHLSPQQIDVLCLMAEGETDKAIALRLGVSEKTAKTIIRNVRGNLGAVSRSNAVALGVEYWTGRARIENGGHSKPPAIV